MITNKSIADVLHAYDILCIFVAFESGVGGHMAITGQKLSLLTTPDEVCILAHFQFSHSGYCCYYLICVENGNKGTQNLDKLSLAQA